MTGVALPSRFQPRSHPRPQCVTTYRQRGAFDGQQAGRPPLNYPVGIDPLAHEGAP